MVGGHAGTLYQLNPTSRLAFKRHNVVLRQILDSPKGSVLILKSEKGNCFRGGKVSFFMKEWSLFCVVSISEFYCIYQPIRHQTIIHQHGIFIVCSFIGICRVNMGAVSFCGQEAERKCDEPLCCNNTIQKLLFNTDQINKIKKRVKLMLECNMNR